MERLRREIIRFHAAKINLFDYRFFSFFTFTPIFDFEPVKCPICGTEFEGGSFDDCPKCDWTFLGYENELGLDEKESSNPVTIRQAKELVEKGMNIWGEPLPKA